MGKELMDKELMDMITQTAIADPGRGGRGYVEKYVGIAKEKEF